MTADEDGVAVVPKARAAEVLKKAQDLDDTEHRMIPFIDQHIIDVLALRSEPEAARGELLAQMFIQFFVFDSGHSGIKLWLLPAAVKIWNNSN